MTFKIYFHKIQYLEKSLQFFYFSTFEIYSTIFGEKNKLQKLVDSVKRIINLHLCFILLTIFEYEINVR